LVRRLIANFISKNGDINISGIKLNDAIKGQQDSLEAFINKEVLVDGMQAQTVVLAIAPLALRIGLNIYILDPQDGAVSLL
jgi:hypothetical protein